MSNADKIIIEQLARIKDINFLKAIFGLLENDDEKLRMADDLTKIKDVTHSDIEKSLLQIVSNRSK